MVFMLRLVLSEIASCFRAFEAEAMMLRTIWVFMAGAAGFVLGAAISGWSRRNASYCSTSDLV